MPDVGQAASHGQDPAAGRDEMLDRRQRIAIQRRNIAQDQQTACTERLGGGAGPREFAQALTRHAPGSIGFQHQSQRRKAAAQAGTVATFDQHDRPDLFTDHHQVARIVTG